MANTRSAGKRARQTLKRAAHNRSVKTHLRRLQKQIRLAPEPTAKHIRAAISAIDKAAKSGVIHRNAANRRKTRLNKALAGEIGSCILSAAKRGEDPAKILLVMQRDSSTSSERSSKCSLHILLAG